MRVLIFGLLFNFMDRLKVANVKEMSLSYCLNDK